MVLAVQRFGVQRGPISQTLMASAVGVRPPASSTGLAPRPSSPDQAGIPPRVRRTPLSSTLQGGAAAVPALGSRGGFGIPMAAQLRGVQPPPDWGMGGGFGPAVPALGRPSRMLLGGFQQQPAGYGQGGSFSGGGSFGGGGGGVSNAAGWEALNRFNAEFSVAARQTGAPANLLKAMVKHESSGNWERDNYVNYRYRGDALLPFVGMYRKTAESYGINFDSLVGNRQAQINAMGTVLTNLSRQYGGYENATKVYFGGPAALTSAGYTDELGTHSSQYAVAIQEWKSLDQMGGGSFQPQGQGAVSYTHLTLPTKRIV